MRKRILRKLRHFKEAVLEAELKQKLGHWTSGSIWTYHNFPRLPSNQFLKGKYFEKVARQYPEKSSEIWKLIQFYLRKKQSPLKSRNQLKIKKGGRDEKETTR